MLQLQPAGIDGGTIDIDGAPCYLTFNQVKQLWFETDDLMRGFYSGAARVMVAGTPVVMEENEWRGINNSATSIIGDFMMPFVEEMDETLKRKSFH